MNVRGLASRGEGQVGAGDGDGRRSEHAPRRTVSGIECRFRRGRDRMSTQTRRCAGPSSSAARPRSPGAGQNTPARRRPRDRPRAARSRPAGCPARSSSRQSAVSSAGGAAVAGVRARAAAARRRRRWRAPGPAAAGGRAGARIASRSPAPSNGSRLKSPSTHQRPVGRAALASRVVAERAAVEIRASRTATSSRLRSRFSRSGPSNSGGVGCAVSRCSVAAARQDHRHVPVRPRRQRERRLRRRVEDRRAIRRAPGRAAPGRSRHGSVRKRPRRAASSGRRDSIAMPPWPGYFPQPSASSQSIAAPSPSRSSPDGRPAFTARREAVADSRSPSGPFAQQRRRRRRARGRADRGRSCWSTSTSGRAACIDRHRGARLVGLGSRGQLGEQHARPVAAQFDVERRDAQTVSAAAPEPRQQTATREGPERADTWRASLAARGVNARLTRRRATAPRAQPRLERVDGLAPSRASGRCRRARSSRQCLRCGVDLEARSRRRPGRGSSGSRDRRSRTALAPRSASSISMSTSSCGSTIGRMPFLKQLL